MRVHSKLNQITYTLINTIQEAKVSTHFHLIVVSVQFSSNGLTNQIFFFPNVSSASKEQEVFTVCTVMHPQKISQ